jgi:hypothetical protein
MLPRIFPIVLVAALGWASSTRAQQVTKSTDTATEKFTAGEPLKLSKNAKTYGGFRAVQSCAESEPRGGADLHQSRHGGCELGGFLPDRLFDEPPQEVAGGSLEDQSATRGSDAGTRDVSFVSSLLRFQLREKVPGGCLEPTEILEGSRDQHRSFERREE